MELIDLIEKAIEEANAMSDEQLQKWCKSEECFDYLNR